MSIFSGVNRVIFDLDNTLIKHNFELANINISKHLGLEGSEEFKAQLDNMFKYNAKYIKGKIVTKEYFAYIIETLMPILKTIDKTGLDLLDVIDKYHSGTLMEGADELLAYLSEKGYQIVVLTNWFYSYQRKILDRLGISKYFERIYAWDDYYAKPSHFAIIRALENTKPNNNVLIGDDGLSDITLAKTSGLKAIGFNVDYSRNSNVLRADVDVTRLVDIQKYL